MSSASPVSDWECSACMETRHNSDYTFVQEPADEDDQSDDDVGPLVCGDCMRYVFQLAYEHEQNYPPRWGAQILKPEDFSNVLGDEFVERYNSRVEEYVMRPSMRVYCVDGCGQYISGLLDFANPDFEQGILRGAEPQNTRLLRKCRNCTKSTWWCLQCGKGCEEPNEAILHNCHSHLAIRAIERAAELGDLVRGRHYQMCPNCELKMELTEACNHVDFACGMEFCYICGEYAGADSAHWDPDRGGCPRYGQPDRGDGMHE